MFYSMGFYHNGWGTFNVRSIKQGGFSDLEKAKKALEKAKIQGYVKKLGQVKPVWSNVK